MLNCGATAVRFAPQRERFLQQSSDLETFGYDTRETERGRFEFNPIEIRSFPLGAGSQEHPKRKNILTLDERVMREKDLVRTGALQVAGVSHFYGKRKALDDVSFVVDPASFTVLLGLNGAGKSTLFSLITRLYATRSGTIRIFGYDVGRQTGEALRRLGVVFQPRTLDLELTVMQNLIYHAALHGIGPQEAKRRARAVLARAGLAERASDKVGNLSGGLIRRVEIARAFLHRPDLLLLDEPTVGLDVKARADIIAQVRGLVASEGIGVLWTTHLIDEIAKTDSVVILHEGKVREKGLTTEILARTGAPDMRTAFVKVTGAELNEGTGR
jgi:ABC-2 type transport system ATP-binding protein